MKKNDELTNLHPADALIAERDALKQRLKDLEKNYHVIPKSDVDGDVMAALDALDDMFQIHCGKYVFSKHDLYVPCDGTIETIRNALIAKSDPDMVRIPRKVLEGMKVEQCKYYVENAQYDRGYNQALNDILNMLKEGE